MPPPQPPLPTKKVSKDRTDFSFYNQVTNSQNFAKVVKLPVRDDKIGIGIEIEIGIKIGVGIRDRIGVGAKLWLNI